MICQTNYWSPRSVCFTPEEKIMSGPSSVELWIESLKDANDIADDSKSDQNSYNGSCSDQDDLHLGAEATDLLHHKNIPRERLQCYSLSDSEDGKSFSRTRHSFFASRKSYERSLDSDTSGLSSTSVSSLLTARESDPEEVLKGLGFARASAIDNIPDRFVNAGTRCEGVNPEQFFCTIQESAPDSSNATSDLPPWVMARVDDIPKKFLHMTSSASLDPLETNQPCPLPIIKEPTTMYSPGGTKELSAATNSRPSKSAPFSSKFGTFLEPVSEEAELSSQGSVNLNVAALKNVSFESNRSSTVKGDSYDELSENINRIPSLKDLWSSQPAETLRNDSESSDIWADDVVEYSPASNSFGRTDEWQTPRDVLRLSSGQRDIPKSDGTIPGLLDHLANKRPPHLRNGLGSNECECLKTDHFPTVGGVIEYSGASDVFRHTNESLGEKIDFGVTSLQPSIPERSQPILGAMDSRTNDVIPSLKETFCPVQDGNLSINQRLTGMPGNGSLSSVNHKQSSSETNIHSNVESESELGSTSYPEGCDKNSIPIIRISPSKKRTRKISTIDVPDYRKLAPEMLVEESSVKIPEYGVDDLTYSKTKMGTSGCKESVVCKETAERVLQLNLYGKWSCIERPLQSQIHIPTKIGVKNSGTLSSRKVADAKVTVMKPTSFPTQIVFPNNSSQDIECFSKVDAPCMNENETFSPSILCSEDSSNFASLVVQSSGSCPENHVSKPSQRVPKPNSGNREKAENFEGYVNQYHCKIKEKELCSCQEIQTEARTKTPSSCVRRTCDGLLSKTGISIEEELDELQSSLRGVKIYKAGIHLMQLASSVISSDTRPVGRGVRSGQILLESIQKELKHSEEYILHLQKQLTTLQKRQKSRCTYEEKPRRGSDVADITAQLLKEQLKVLNSISSSASSSPTSSRRISFDDSSSFHTTEDSVVQNDIKKLRQEVRILHHENENRHLMIKNEILSEVRTEIRNCFREFTGNCRE